MIRGYTNIEQSRKLAEILPPESADMYYDDIVDRVTGELFIPDDGSTIKVGKGFGDSIVAWSLAALLDVLPEYNLQRTDWENDKTEYKIVVYVNDNNYASKNYDNPIDACVAMIEKLNELDLL